MSEIYGSMGEIVRRLMKLEEENAQQKERIRLLEQERLPRLITAEEIYWCKSQGTGFASTGTVDIWGDGGVSLGTISVTSYLGAIPANKYGYAAKVKNSELIHVLNWQCSTS
jgi:hypothetical protein